MTARTLTVNLRNIDESAVASALVTLRLMEVDHTGAATIVVSSDSETTDGSGDCTFSSVIPNVDGTQNRKYIITANSGGVEVLNEEFQMPDANSSLHDLVDAVVIDSSRVVYTDTAQDITGEKTFKIAAAVDGPFFVIDGDIGGTTATPITTLTTSATPTHHFKIELDDGTTLWVPASTNVPT